MLKQRVLTAVALLAVLLPALLSASEWPFLVFVAAAMAAAGWEWARLNGVTGALALGAGLAVLLLVAAVLFAGPLPMAVWSLVLLVWVLGGAQVLRGGSPGWQGLPRVARMAIGLLALVPAGVAMVLWKTQGLNALLSVLCLVWVADIAAYFGGRRWGRRKLAPAISPGKSWEGVWSGWLGVLLLGLAWAHWIDPWLGGLSLYGQLVRGLGWPLALLALLLLALLSVLGDLFESLVKRAAGAKDSSKLLPGHGGVLDRVDALLPTLPAALALTQLAQGMPQ